MKRLLLAGFVAAAATLAATAGHAEGTAKIGLIISYSGQFADTAAQMDNGIKLYMKQHGDTVAGKKLEFVRKDIGGIAPDVAKRLAQELVVRDHADILAGFALTPNALAAADVSAEAKKFMVVMNAATSIITTKSPYIARTSLTTPQLNQSSGTWAAKQRHQDGLYDGLRLRPRHRRRNRFPARLQGGRRQYRRLGSLSGRQSGFLGVRSARQGHQSRCDLHLDSRRRATAAIGKALAERGIDASEDESPGPGRADL